MPSENSRALLRYAQRPWEIAFNLAYWRRARCNDLKVTFVLGAPRSGTTLIHRLLLNHSRFSGFEAETSIFSPKSVRDYARFASFVDAAEHRAALTQSEDIVSFFATLHRNAFPQVDQADAWFVEKTPQHVKRLGFILDKFPNARVIHVVRDARDAFCSGRAAGNIPQAYQLDDYARYWNRCISARRAMTDKRIYDLRYEKFVSTPDSELERVMAFLGERLESDAQFSPERMADDPRGSETAFARLKGPINASSVGRWRAELSEAEKRRFWERTAHNMQAFDYER